MSVIFSPFVCALFGFCVIEFPAKYEKKPGTFFADCTWYITCQGICNEGLCNDVLLQMNMAALFGRNSWAHYETRTYYEKI